MSHSRLLSERDVDGVLSVLGLVASMEGVQPFALPVLQRLVELIPAEGAGYWEWVSTPRRHPTFVGLTRSPGRPMITVCSSEAVRCCSPTPAWRRC